jgi:hypothetical protein
MIIAKKLSRRCYVAILTAPLRNDSRYPAMQLFGIVDTFLRF